METSFNNILRTIWKLPRQYHTRILHCVAGVKSLFNVILNRFSTFESRGFESNSSLIRSVFSWASSHAYTAIGANLKLIKGDFVKVYSNDDIACAEFVRDIRLGRIMFDSIDTTNSILQLCLL